MKSFFQKERTRLTIETTKDFQYAEKWLNNDQIDQTYPIISDSFISHKKEHEYKKGYYSRH